MKVDSHQLDRGITFARPIGTYHRVIAGIPCCRGNLPFLVLNRGSPGRAAYISQVPHAETPLLQRLTCSILPLNFPPNFPPNFNSTCKAPTSNNHKRELAPDQSFLPTTNIPRVQAIRHSSTYNTNWSGLWMWHISSTLQTLGGTIVRI